MTDEPHAFSPRGLATPPRPLRLAIDMDGVLVDTLPAQLAFLQNDCQVVPEWPDPGAAWPPAGAASLGALLRPDIQCRLHAHMSQPGFFADLPPMAGAIDAVRRLAQQHEVFIATAAMEFPTSFNAKYAWLRRHLPFLDPLKFVFCGCKTMLDVDWLIDDSPRHFQGFRGQALLFSSPFNRHIQAHRRLNAWHELPALFALG